MRGLRDSAKIARVKSAFQARLVNGPFGDPGLFVALRWTGKALLFDLGRLDRFPAAELLKVRAVFVSHTHMDHFIGFDHFLRLFLAREKRVDLYGPWGIVENVAGKLRGYTWNLVESYPLVLDVHDVGRDRVRRVRFAARKAFAAEELDVVPFEGTLLREPGYRVRATHLDHRIDCLAFALEEDTHLNVRTDELARLGVPPGPWLNRLKDAVRKGEAPETEIVAEWTKEGRKEKRTFRLGELRDRLLRETPGQKIAYVTDALFSEENVARVVELVRGADLFFCESLFVDADREQATRRYHMTARQAGTLARLAGVRRLEVFHFSPRYDGEPERLRNEAQAAFDGTLPEDVPVRGRA
ncbi:MAG: ribonuclease Z [Candidatus Binatia bacterium]|nr:MAG: ribonuclease Z [Candidatus Binatia bacterium]